MSIKNERASKKQQELLAFVDGFIKGNGYGPSYREIMRALGYKSVSTVAIHIDALIAKGYLRRADKSARSLEVVTLRDSHTAQPAAPVVDVEAELIKRIATLTISPEQKKQLKEAMLLLGFEKVATHLEVDAGSDIA